MECNNHFETDKDLVTNEEQFDSAEDYYDRNLSDKIELLDNYNSKDPNNNANEENKTGGGNSREMAHNLEHSNHGNSGLRKKKKIMTTEIDFDTVEYEPIFTHEDESNPSLESSNSREDRLISTVIIENDKIVYENENPDSERSSTIASHSSVDESEGEQSPVQVTKTKRHRRISSDSRSSSHNFNSNNSKKKSLLCNQKDRSVNFSDSFQESRNNPSAQGSSSNSRRNRFEGKGRVRSVQLSSIRNLPRTRGNRPATFVSKKLKYGQRLIEKDGSSNVLATKINKVDLINRYFNDIFTTLLDSSWTSVLFITASVYIGHWFIFGLVYWLIAIWHNDYERIIGSETSSLLDANSTEIHQDPCVFNVYDGVTAFLFSMESETTIGYGYRTITTACPHAVIWLTLQCIISAIFDTWVIGMCFARLARPDARTITTMFSKQAVVCKRDGKRCLLVRFANLRKSLLLSVSVRARLITLRTAQSDEKNAGFQGMLEQRQVTFENASSALLTAPIEYRHIIDKDSPFYISLILALTIIIKVYFKQKTNVIKGIKPDLYNSADGNDYFELVFIVTGTLESTGLTMQAQTSYLSSEILYGHRFSPIVSKSYEKGKYVVDFKYFHGTEVEPPFKGVTEETNPRARDTTTPLLEETEEDILSASDDVFSSNIVGTKLAESVL